MKIFPQGFVRDLSDLFLEPYYLFYDDGYELDCLKEISAMLYHPSQLSTRGILVNQESSAILYNGSDLTHECTCSDTLPNKDDFTYVQKAHGINAGGFFSDIEGGLYFIKNTTQSLSNSSQWIDKYTSSPPYAPSAL